MPKQDKKATVKTDQNISWWRRRRLDIIVATLLMLTSFLVTSTNMSRYPQRFEDEGTYISQAWAVQNRGTLAHYTYWYDHPPLAWIQTAGYMTISQAVDRHSSAVTAGREFMVVLHVISVGLLYALARRLKIGMVAAGIGTLIYTLSPLVIEFSRYVLLDNVALPWLLGAFFLALSPRRHIKIAISSALCMAIAILSKETFLLLLPVLIYAFWQSSDIRNRRYELVIFSMVFLLVSSLYILYAVLKSELFPGEGHVSLLGTTMWQLFEREGSGSILNNSSGTYGLVKYWLNIDPWLLITGMISLPFAFLFRNLRVVALCFLIGLASLLRGGYLPYPYIIVLLPFAALVFAGVLHQVVIERFKTKKFNLQTSLAGAAALGVILLMTGIIVPNWQTKLKALTSEDRDASSRAAIEWIDQNIPHSSRIVVESALWTDLQNMGYSHPGPVWLYKTETDPAVAQQIGGWQGIDYIALNGPTIGSADFNTKFPTVAAALKSSYLLKEIGKDNQKILIFQVKH